MVGCVSIVDGTNQILSVKTISAGQSVADAQCSLENGKGTWFVKTPGSVTVHRADGAMNVNCKKDGYQPAVMAVKSTTKSMAFGNILFGGLIGDGVDMSDGAAHNYPSLIAISMQSQSLALAPVPPIVSAPSS